MKPRIKKVSSWVWECSGNGESALGMSPAYAYMRWRIDVQDMTRHANLVARMERLAGQHQNNQHIIPKIVIPVRDKR